MSSRFSKYIKNNTLPILISHGEDCTVSILLSEHDMNRVKLCSYDIYRTITEPSSDLQWYSTKIDSEGVYVIRAVKQMLNIPHVPHVTDTVHSLFDLENIMNHDNEVTEFYRIMSEIIKIVR